MSKFTSHTSARWMGLSFFRNVVDTPMKNGVGTINSCIGTMGEQRTGTWLEYHGSTQPSLENAFLIPTIVYTLNVQTQREYTPPPHQIVMWSTAKQDSRQTSKHLPTHSTHSTCMHRCKHVTICKNMCKKHHTHHPRLEDITIN